MIHVVKCTHYQPSQVAPVAACKRTVQIETPVNDIQHDVVGLFLLDEGTMGLLDRLNCRIVNRRAIPAVPRGQSVRRRFGRGITGGEARNVPVSGTSGALDGVVGWRLLLASYANAIVVAGMKLGKWGHWKS